MLIMILYTPWHNAQDGDKELHQIQDVKMPPKLDPSGPTERIQLVAPPDWVKRLDEWRRVQPKIPNRSEAIRYLVDAALNAKTD